MIKIILRKNIIIDKIETKFISLYFLKMYQIKITELKVNKKESKIELLFSHFKTSESKGIV